MILHRHDSPLHTGNLPFVNLLAPLTVCAPGLNIFAKQHSNSPSNTPCSHSVELDLVVLHGGPDLGDG